MTHRPRPFVLMILDGWGYRQTPDANAIAAAKKPNWDRLWEENIAALSKTENVSEDKILLDDEILVYVHLFNASGANVNSWKNMLKGKVFYEYSVNRPIYANKSDVEAFIRSKSNKVQHGFLTIAVKKEYISFPGETEKADALGHALIKVKEGTLHAERLFSFTHNLIDYRVSEEGEITKI